MLMNLILVCAQIYTCPNWRSLKSRDREEKYSDIKRKKSSTHRISLILDKYIYQDLPNLQSLDCSRRLGGEGGGLAYVGIMHEILNIWIRGLC